MAVTRGGRAYNASFREDGGVVHVDSACGSMSGAVGRREPKRVADELLDRIVSKSRD